MTNVDLENPASGPLGFLKAWAKDNPQQAALLFGGIACFAAVSVVLGFGLRFEGIIAPIFYILGVGVALAIATRIVNDKLMMTGLSWFALGLGVLWVITFVVYKSAPLSSTRSQQLYCIVYFWIDCKTNVDEDTRTAAPASTPPVKSPTPVAANIQPSRYQVFVQFAGVLTRDSVRAMMQKLKEQGWNVQGVAGGGERKASAAGTSEIRFKDGDEAAAQALAASVQTFGLTARPVGVKQNNTIDSGTLEVWISR
jgi:hypothetical protein